MLNNPLIFIDPLGLQGGDCDESDTRQPCRQPCGAEWWIAFGGPPPEDCEGQGTGVDITWDSGGGGGGGTTPGNGAFGGSFPNGESLGIPYGLQVGPFTLWQLLGIPNVGFGCDPFGLCGGDVPGSGFQAQAAAATPFWVRVTSWGLTALETVGRYAGLVGILASVAMMPSDVVPPSQRDKPQAPAKAQPKAVPRVPSPDPCSQGLQMCLENPWQPSWNAPTFGKRKDCGACYRECKGAGGVWPEYKYPR